MEKFPMKPPKSTSLHPKASIDTACAFICSVVLAVSAWMKKKWNQEEFVPHWKRQWILPLYARLVLNGDKLIHSILWTGVNDWPHERIFHACTMRLWASVLRADIVPSQAPWSLFSADFLFTDVSTHDVRKSEVLLFNSASTMIYR